MAKKWILIFVVLLAMFAAGGAGAWYWLRAPQGKPSEATEQADVRDYKYVSLDKVIVMLRDHAGEPLDHYLAVDLVFKTSEDNEKITKEHLPLLRSIAVRALSAYPMDQARLMTIDQYTSAINRAYTLAYAHDRRAKPFAEAMIGKLIIE